MYDGEGVRGQDSAFSIQGIRLQMFIAKVYKINILLFP
jgi:hypothetical protein